MTQRGWWDRWRVGDRQGLKLFSFFFKGKPPHFGLENDTIIILASKGEGNAKMAILSSKFPISSRGNTDVIDITPEVQEIVGKSKIEEGSVLIFITGSTAGVTTIEFEPGLVQDLKEAFERIAPQSIPYAHHEKWGDDNGHAHIRASFLGPALLVPVTEGKLTLGTWQQIVVVDFDTRPRQRQIVVQLTGEKPDREK